MRDLWGSLPLTRPSMDFDVAALAAVGNGGTSTGDISRRMVALGAALRSTRLMLFDVRHMSVVRKWDAVYSTVALVWLPHRQVLLQGVLIYCTIACEPPTCLCFSHSYRVLACGQL